MREGYIDQVVVFVPRLNLAAQFELDWEWTRGRLPWVTTMQKLLHRNNDPPLLWPGADGYITTYQSLVVEPMLHIRQVANRRTLVIFDEADRLGADQVNNDFTLTAKWSEEVGTAAVATFVMSGTPYRADNKPLLFATYADPDATGYRQLNADVSATYRDGVRDGYLRRFDFRLVDGQYTLRRLNGETKHNIKQTEEKLSELLQNPDIYQPLIDEFVDRLNDQKRKVDMRICGLVAANGQTHARKIKQYIDKNYPQMKTLIAVSDDGAAAHKSLRRFKEGRHDILITVSMAYIGYDHKPISVLLLLTSYRSEPYLRQLVARGLRMWNEVPIDRQHCLAIVPDDKRMVDFVNALRGESEFGYNERAKRRDDAEHETGDYQQELSYITDAFITEVRAMGIDPNGDLPAEQLPIVQGILDRMGLPWAAPDAWSFIRTFQEINAAPRPAPEAPRKTAQEQMAEASSTLKKLANKCDYHVFNSDFGRTYNRLWDVYGKSVTKCTTLEEYEERIFTVQRWLNEGRFDGRK